MYLIHLINYLLRITKYVICLVNYLKQKVKKQILNVQFLQSMDIEKIEFEWIRAVQKEVSCNKSYFNHK